MRGMRITVVAAIAVFSFVEMELTADEANDESLLLHYDFNEIQEGKIKDLSGHGRDGSVKDGKLEDGVEGTALAFNGETSWLDCEKTDALDLSAGGTASFWIYPEFPVKGGIACFGPEQWRDRRFNLLLRGDTNHKPCFTFSDGDRHYKTFYWGGLSMGFWQHLAITFDGKNLVLYENGLPLETMPVNMTPNVKGRSLVLGYVPICGQYFKGRLDDFRLYDRGLSAKEIDALYRTGAAALAATSKPSKAEPKPDAESNEQAFRVTITNPPYRNNIYATEDVKAIAFKTFFGKTIPSDACLTASLKQRDEVLYSVEFSDLEDGKELSIPLPELDTGRYELVCEFSDGEETFVDETIINKLPPCSSEVRVGENQRVLFNGEPFMPLGWYWDYDEPFSEEKLLNMNTVHTYAWFTTRESLTAFLDQCHQFGLKAIIKPYQLDTGLRRKKLQEWETIPENELEILRRTVSSINQHPALLGWYMADEPESHHVKPNVLRTLYETVRDADPYHPCIITNTHDHGVRTFIDCADVMMPDEYANFQTDGVPMSSLTKILDIVEAADGRRPVWIVPQAWNWRDMIGSQSQPRSRGPDYVDLRNNVFLAITAGATGAVWYHSRRAFAVPSVKYGYGHLTRELTVLKPAVLAPETPDVVEIRPRPAPISHSFRNVDGKLYLFAVNHSPERQNVHFVFKEKTASTLLVVSEGRLAAVKENGVMSDHFKPFETHVYTNDFSPELMDLPTVDEIEGIIASNRRKALRGGNLLAATRPQLTLSGSFLEENLDNLIQGYAKKDPVRLKELILRHLCDGDLDRLRYAQCQLAKDQWLSIDMAQPTTMNRIVMTMADDEIMDNGKVEIQVNDEWRTMALIKGNKRRALEFKLDPVKASAIKVTSASDKPVTIVELGAFHDENPNPDLEKGL